MQRTAHAHALEGLLRRILFADCDKTGHFVLGNVDFFSAPSGKLDIGNFIFLFFHKFYFLDTRRILTA